MASLRVWELRSGRLYLEPDCVGAARPRWCRCWGVAAAAWVEVVERATRCASRG